MKRKETGSKEIGSKEVCENTEISSGFTVFRGQQVLPLLNQLNQYRSVLYRFFSPLPSPAFPFFHSPLLLFASLISENPPLQVAIDTLHTPRCCQLSIGMCHLVSSSWCYTYWVVNSFAKYRCRGINMRHISQHPRS